MKKKKSKKKSLFKRLRGFTLVELLAVIVILAIIMIIAIPAVLNTLESARRKTLLEFGQKCLNTAEQVYLEKTTLESLIHPSEETNYYFDVRKDLGISNTGDFYGVVVINSLYNDKGERVYNYQLTIMDKENFIYYDKWGDGELTDDLVHSNSENPYYGAFAGKKLDEIDFKQLFALGDMYQLCNWWDTSAVDVATNTQMFCTNNRNRQNIKEDNLSVCKDEVVAAQNRKLEVIMSKFLQGEIVSNCP